jgi:hypothetical protein
MVAKNGKAMATEETITNEQTIERWAEFIIPTVFKGEDELLKTKPEWRERLRNVKPEEASEVSVEYCYDIARLIVSHSQTTSEHDTSEY